MCRIKEKSEADSYVIFVGAPISFLKNLKITRFTVEFQTLKHMK